MLVPALDMVGSTPLEELQLGLVTYRGRGMMRAACGDGGGRGTRCRT
jgi:hypothetical protein